MTACETPEPPLFHEALTGPSDNHQAVLLISIGRFRPQTEEPLRCSIPVRARIEHRFFLPENALFYRQKIEP